jgi:hypothetical protein
MGNDTPCQRATLTENAERCQGVPRTLCIAPNLRRRGAADTWRKHWLGCQSAKSADPLALILARQLQEMWFAVAFNDGEQIVQVVSSTLREPADGFHDQNSRHGALNRKNAPPPVHPQASPIHREITKQRGKII